MLGQGVTELAGGLSPQARGKQQDYGRDNVFDRAYPRRHGGNRGRELGQSFIGGLSPQARGKRPIHHGMQR